MASNQIAMASNQLAMASNQKAMYSNLIAMASLSQIVMASNQILHKERNAGTVRVFEQKGFTRTRSATQLLQGRDNHYESNKQGRVGWHEAKHT